jgi:hypothetical protein
LAATYLGFRIHLVEKDYAVATHGRMMQIMWKGQTTVEAVDRAKQILIGLVADRTTTFGLMQVVELNAPPPDSDARQALAGLLAVGEGSVACSSIVYPGTGFLAAAARAVVTGLTMLAQPGFPHLIFPTTEKAAEWHAQLMAGPSCPSRLEICSDIERLRAALGR